MKRPTLDDCLLALCVLVVLALVCAAVIEVAR